MRLQDKCLPCIVNQAIKVANMTKVTDKEQLLHEVFSYLSRVSFEFKTPEITGEVFELIKKYTNNPDPYFQTRTYYNEMFLKLSPQFEEKINQAKRPFEQAVRYAIVGNIIDFNPIHNTMLDDVLYLFEQMDGLTMAIDDTKLLTQEIGSAKSLLYLGDNCGEICLDRLLIKKIKECNPDLAIYFGVRGKPVVNDSIAADAYAVGIDQYAEIIDNGDGSLGTVLHRASPEFLKVYEQADIVIAKGQSNYECLSEEKKNIYFLLMTKCDVIARNIGVEQKKMICMKTKANN